ncbi:MAG: MoaD/ThiS family protein [Desulfobacteraceae bacterium]|nr:MAG: MoaD/ThiS family protein [Desulfobacteraceae bacterium]
MIKVDGTERPWRPGMTVADLLREMPDPSYHYAVVRLNQDIVVEPLFAKTQIPDNAEIYLVPMVVGG